MKNFKIMIYSYYKGIIFITAGILFLGIFLYRSIFIISSRLENKIQKEKIYSFNKENWCHSQVKYFSKNNLFYPITFKSYDSNNTNNHITRHGYVSVNPKAKANILLCHGFMTNKEDMFLLRYFFKDFNVINFDFRAHGENISTQSCTLGHDEKHDVIGAVNYIKRDKNINHLPLFVYGFSMGAVASILAESENPHLFTGAIWDCPFESTKELTNQALEKLKFNICGYNIDFPFKNIIRKYIYNHKAQGIIKLFFKLFSILDGTKINMVIKKVSPLKAIKNISIPFFLIGCHNDDKAPVEAIKNMYYQHQEDSFVRCWISPGRRHFDALFINPEKYICKIKKFIHTIIKDKHNYKERKKITIDPCVYKVNKKFSHHTIS